MFSDESDYEFKSDDKDLEPWKHYNEWNKNSESKPVGEQNDKKEVVTQNLNTVSKLIISY